MNRELAWYILSEKGYNWALLDVQEACEFLDHPELLPENPSNYHKWAEPYPRRCYCGMIGYTEKGRFNAVELTDDHIKILQKIFPDFKDNYNKPYMGEDRE